MKKSHENSDSAYGQGLKSSDNPNSNPNAKSFSSNSKYDSKNKLSKDATEENIRDNVFQQLRKNGPMKESDKILTSDLRIEATKLIQESKELIQLLKADERFGSFANYLWRREGEEVEGHLWEPLKPFLKAWSPLYSTVHFQQFDLKVSHLT